VLLHHYPAGFLPAKSSITVKQIPGQLTETKPGTKVAVIIKNGLLWLFREKSEKIKNITLVSKPIKKEGNCLFQKNFPRIQAKLDIPVTPSRYKVANTNGIIILIEKSAPKIPFVIII